MNICIFGDSIAHAELGHKLGGWANRFRLAVERSDYDGHVYKLGVSGDNTEDLLTHFEIEAESRDAKRLIFAIGVNDSIFLRDEKRNRVPIDKFSNNIELLISKATKFTKDIIFVGLTPVDESKTTPIPWSTNKEYRNAYIEKYNTALQNICNNKKIPFIAIFKQLQRENLNDIMLDGLHPNVAGHEKIYEIVYPEIIRLWPIKNKNK